MSTRIRINGAAIKSRDQLVSIVQETVDMQLRRERQVSARDLRLEKINKEFNPTIESGDSAIAENLALIEQWADAHRDEFGKAKSCDVVGHIIGWRVGNPTAKARKKFTWSSVLENLKGLSSDLVARFVRVKEEVNKDALIAARDVMPEVLFRAGIEIVQEERFFLEPNREGQAEATLRAEAKAAA